jgi:ribonuclease HI
MTEELKDIVIYTDGACSGNPGPGGYGVVLLAGKHRKELSGGFRLTTNNRMELMGVIVGLKALKKKSRVTLYSDSQYVVEALRKGWANQWRDRGWRRSNKEVALNSDLWEMLLDLVNQHEVEFIWVQSHAGNLENERCDELAVAASKNKDLPRDIGYETSVSQRLVP